MARISKQDLASLLAVYLVQRNPLLGGAQQQAFGHLFEVALYEREAPCSYSELADAAAELVGLSAVWADELARPAIERCVEMDRVSLEDGKYSLTNATQQGLEDARQLYQADEAVFDERLVATIEQVAGRKVEDLAVPFITSEVKRAVAETLQRCSIELSPGETVPRITEAASDFDPVPQLRACARTITETFGLGSEETLVAAVRRFLGELDQRSQRFVAGLYNKVFYRQVLNADPSLHRVQREAFGRLRLYLDTNIAIDLLLDDLDDHPATAEVLTAARRLGVQLFVSPITIRELEGQIEAAERQLATARDSRIQALLANSKFNRGTPPFLIAFLRRKRKQASLTWTGFVGPHRDVEQSLLGKDVLPDSEGYEGIADDPLYDEVWRGLRELRREGASDRVIEHDAQNFLLVHKLRAASEDNILFGPSIWLLTRDSTLARLERRMARKHHVPHSFHRDEWGRLLMPYQGILDFTFSDYVTDLVQSRLGIVPEGESLDLAFLESVQHPEFDLADILQLPEEHAASVLISLQGDRQAQQLAETLHQSDSPDERSRAGRQLSERALTIAVEEKQAALHEASQREARVRGLENQLSERDVKLAQLEAEVRTRDEELRRVHARSLMARIKRFLGLERGRSGLEE